MDIFGNPTGETDLSSLEQKTQNQEGIVGETDFSGILKLNGISINAGNDADIIALQTKTQNQTAVAGLTTFTGALTAFSCTGAIDMNNNKITELGAPTVPTDATNKTYVDTLVGTPCRLFYSLCGVINDFNTTTNVDIVPIGLLVDGSASTSFKQVQKVEFGSSNRSGNTISIPVGGSGWYSISIYLYHPNTPILGSNAQEALGTCKVGIIFTLPTASSFGEYGTPDETQGTPDSMAFQGVYNLAAGVGFVVRFDHTTTPLVNEDFIFRMNIIRIG